MEVIILALLFVCILSITYIDHLHGKIKAMNCELRLWRLQYQQTTVAQLNAASSWPMYACGAGAQKAEK